MSSWAEIHLVDVDKVEAACGSCDEALVARILERDREYFEDDIEERGEDELSEIEAVRMLVFGESIEAGDWWNVHSAALQAIIFECGGESIGDPNFSRLEWIGSGLEDMNLDNFTVDLMACNYWGNDSCREMWEQCRTVTEEQLNALDPRLRVAVEEYMGWLRQAASSPNLGLWGIGWYG